MNGSSLYVLKQLRPTLLLQYLLAVNGVARKYCTLNNVHTHTNEANIIIKKTLLSLCVQHYDQLVETAGGAY